MDAKNRSLCFKAINNGHAEAAHCHSHSSRIGEPTNCYNLSKAHLMNELSHSAHFAVSCARCCHVPPIDWSAKKSLRSVSHRFSGRACARWTPRLPCSSGDHFKTFCDHLCRTGFMSLPAHLHCLLRHCVNHSSWLAATSRSSTVLAALFRNPFQGSKSSSAASDHAPKSIW